MALVHWGAFVQDFEEAVPHARVIALDMPGNGALHRLASPTDVRAMAAFCRDALARRGAAPPYCVLAMSLGAMVAVAWADAHPREIARCVLINTSLRPFSPVHRRLRPCAWPPLLMLALPWGGTREREQAILALTSRLYAGDPKWLDDWTAWHTQCTVTRTNALRQLWAAARYRAPRAKPAPAMLILASHHDRLVHVGCSLGLARAWGCPLRVHPDAGHDVPLDDGPWVAAAVRRWLSGPG